MCSSGSDASWSAACWWKELQAIDLVIEWKELSTHTEDGGSGNTQRATAVWLTTSLWWWCWRSNLSSWEHLECLCLLGNPTVSFSCYPPLPPVDLSSHPSFRESRCYSHRSRLPCNPHLLPVAIHRDTQAPLFQAAERLLWQWLSWCWCSVLKVVVVEVVVELREVVVVVVAAAGAAAVNVQGWEALRIQPVSGRGRGEAAYKSWAACPGRSAGRKEEEGGRWWWWEWRRGGAGIPRTLSSSNSRISHLPLPPSPPHCLLSPLWHLRLFIMRSSGGSCAPCTRSITSSRTGRPSVGTPCRRYTRGGNAVLPNPYQYLARVHEMLWIIFLISLVNLLQAFSQHSGDASQEEHAGKWELRCKRHYGSPADPRVWGSLVG